MGYIIKNINLKLNTQSFLKVRNVVPILSLKSRRNKFQDVTFTVRTENTKKVKIQRESKAYNYDFEKNFLPI